MTDSVLVFENKTLTIIEESPTLQGGRAKLGCNDKGYTQIDIEKHEDEVLISIVDNITDVDGHWSPITLSRVQFEEFKDMLDLI